jgi:outer membrane protein OmpA-like peptidoglycan-associated protein
MKKRLTTALLLSLAIPGFSQQNYSDVMTRAEQLRKDQRWEDALAAYREAAGRAEDLKQAARADYRIAQIYEEMHDTDAALLWYRSSLERASYPETEAAIKRLQAARFSRVVTADEIVNGLNVPPKRSQGVKPSFDLPVNFDFDKDTLTEDGRKQVSELARALSNSAFSNDRFALVGHTDKRGTDEYNLALSEKRARRVEEVLHQQFGMDSGRFDVQAMGKRQLLFQGDSEEDQRLNRRVEVKLLRGGN